MTYFVIYLFLNHYIITNSNKKGKRFYQECTAVQQNPETGFGVKNPATD